MPAELQSAFLMKSLSDYFYLFFFSSYTQQGTMAMKFPIFFSSKAASLNKRKKLLHMALLNPTTENESMWVPSYPSCVEGCQRKLLLSHPIYNSEKCWTTERQGVAERKAAETLREHQKNADCTKCTEDCMSRWGHFACRFPQLTQFSMHLNYTRLYLTGKKNLI